MSVSVSVVGPLRGLLCGVPSPDMTSNQFGRWSSSRLELGVGRCSTDGLYVSNP